VGSGRTRPSARAIALVTTAVAAIRVQASLNAPTGSPGEAPWSSATSTAIPSTAPTCRRHASTALPVANRADGSPATAALPHAAKLRPTPLPVRNCPGSSSVV
jgi:hypothetical protein